MKIETKKTKASLDKEILEFNKKHNIDILSNLSINNNKIYFKPLCLSIDERGEISIILDKYGFRMNIHYEGLLNKDIKEINNLIKKGNILIEDLESLISFK